MCICVKHSEKSDPVIELVHSTIAARNAHAARSRKTLSNGHASFSDEQKDREEERGVHTSTSNDRQARTSAVDVHTTAGKLTDRFLNALCRP